MDRFYQESFQPIDDEEKALMASIEQDEWQSIENVGEERMKVQSVARHKLKPEIQESSSTKLNEDDEPINEIKSIVDFLPPPEELAFRKEDIE